MKLISDLQVGDKAFVIIKSDWTLDVAEVIELDKGCLRFQLYLSTVLFGDKFYLWQCYTTRYDSFYLILFTDENEAIEAFQSKL